MTWLIGKSSPVASSNSRLIVDTVLRGPPISYAALILFVPAPGTCTFRSRGSDISAIRRVCGSTRASRIVSERGLTPATLSA